MIKKHFSKALLLAVALLAVFTLSACGGEEEATLESTHAYSEVGPYEHEGSRLGEEVDTVQVNLYDDNTYRAVLTSVTVMNEDAGGTVTWEYTGTYEKGEAQNGFKELTLSDADEAIYTSYSSMGGYAFQYNSEKVEDWSSVELGGEIDIQSEEEFLSYVEGETYYIALNSNNEETSQLSKTGAE